MMLDGTSPFFYLKTFNSAYGATEVSHIDGK